MTYVNITAYRVRREVKEEKKVVKAARAVKVARKRRLKLLSPPLLRTSLMTCSMLILRLRLLPLPR